MEVVNIVQFLLTSVNLENTLRNLFKDLFHGEYAMETTDYQCDRFK